MPTTPESYCDWTFFARKTPIESWTHVDGHELDAILRRSRNYVEIRVLEVIHTTETSTSREILATRDPALKPTPTTLHGSTDAFHCIWFAPNCLSPYVLDQVDQQRSGPLRQHMSDVLGFLAGKQGLRPAAGLADPESDVRAKSANKLLEGFSLSPAFSEPSRYGTTSVVMSFKRMLQAYAESRHAEPEAVQMAFASLVVYRRERQLTILVYVHEDADADGKLPDKLKNCTTVPEEGARSRAVPQAQASAGDHDGAGSNMDVDSPGPPPAHRHDGGTSGIPSSLVAAGAGAAPQPSVADTSAGGDPAAAIPIVECIADRTGIKWRLQSTSASSRCVMNNPDPTLGIYGSHLHGCSKDWDNLAFALFYPDAAGELPLSFRGMQIGLGDAEEFRPRNGTSSNRPPSQRRASSAARTLLQFDTGPGGAIGDRARRSGPELP